MVRSATAAFLCTLQNGGFACAAQPTRNMLLRVLHVVLVMYELGNNT